MILKIIPCPHRCQVELRSLVSTMPKFRTEVLNSYLGLISPHRGPARNDLPSRDLFPAQGNNAERAPDHPFRSGAPDFAWYDAFMSLPGRDCDRHRHSYRVWWEESGMLAIKPAGRRSREPTGRAFRGTFSPKRVFAVPLFFRNGYRSLSTGESFRPKASATPLKVTSPWSTLAPFLISTLSCIAFFHPFSAICTA